jgi:predicted methyltransferase
MLNLGITMNKSLAILATALLFGCQQSPDAVAEAPAEEAAAPAAEEVTLESLLAAQPDDVRARYQYRRPQETLEFFGIEPGMVVVEGLPGSVWYTKVLLPYLGSEGHLVGANYAMDMWPNFSFATEEFMKMQSTWVTDWPVGAEEWRGDAGATIAAFNLGSMPAEMNGTADVVFFARVLHNLANFDSKGGFLTAALADAYAVLKPGGTFGVVQHHARDEMSDDFADGSHGYLKKSFVIAVAESAGFVFVAESDINANPADQPTEDDIVWRLPPSLGTSGENEELKAELVAVGESNRMTLKFRKPD